MNLAPPLTCLGNILQVICDADNAVGGFVQLVDADGSSMHVCAHHGLSAPFVRHFRRVSPSDGTTCAQALMERRRVVIRDIETDDAYAPHRAITNKEGIRAIQSTPLINEDRHSLGVMTTFYQKAAHPGPLSLDIIDRCAEVATQVIEADRLERRLSMLYSKSGMPHRPVTDDVARAADAARGLLRSLSQQNYENMLPASAKNLRLIVDELSYQVERQEV